MVGASGQSNIILRIPRNSDYGVATLGGVPAQHDHVDANRQMLQNIELRLINGYPSAISTWLIYFVHQYFVRVVVSSTLVYSGLSYYSFYI